MLPLRRATLLIGSVLLCLALLGCPSNGDQNTIETGTEFAKEGTLAFLQPSGDTLRTIDIEIADTPEERERGLMFRRSMGYTRGMLFIFDTADEGGFWMKNTAMPLDIIFVAPDSQVVSIAERTRPFSEESIDPEGPKQFVVEVRAGFVNRFGITDSTRIRWQRTN
jgi:hypothetical protein